MISAMRKPFIRRPIFSADVQRLGGVVSVAAGRDRVEGTPRYHVVHRSAGRDCIWQSPALESETDAIAGARLLSMFVGADLVI